MGRLFTYMVKAAAEQQPLPSPEYYQFRELNQPGKGVPYQPSHWNDFLAYFGHLPFTSGTERDLAQQANFVKRMFNASRSSNADAFFDIKGAADYAKALNSNFTSPAAIYDYLKSRSEYRAALQQLADNGSYDGLERIWAKAGDAPGMTDPTWGWRSDYQLSSGAGNAQLIMNMYMAEEARRKKAAEEAKPKAPGPQPQPEVAPKPAAPVRASSSESSAVVPPDTGTQPAATSVSPTVTGTQPATAGTFNEPAFVSSPMQVSFYNLPEGMSQQEAMQNWNRIGNLRVQRYLEATGRQGAKNIQVSPDGSTIRFMHSNGGSTETDTSLPRLAPPKLVRKETPSKLVRKETNSPRLVQKVTPPSTLRRKVSPSPTLRQKETNSPRLVQKVTPSPTLRQTNKMTRGGRR